MTKHEASALIAQHGSQRAAARAAGCSHHTIARALAGPGAHRGDGNGRALSAPGPGWQRPTSDAYADGEDEATVAWGPVVVVAVGALIAAWVTWRWWKTRRETRRSVPSLPWDEDNRPRAVGDGLEEGGAAA